MLLDKSSDYLNIREELVKKREVLGVSDDRLAEQETPSADNQLSSEKRQENTYVLTYMKSHIPKYAKELGRRMTRKEIQAVIAEARVAYND
jgi:hypothetical protein